MSLHHSSLSILILLIFGANMIFGQNADEMFSPERIVEYNRLIGCFSNINHDFQACNNWAKDKADKYLDLGEWVLGKDSEALKLAKCCGMWIVRDCWLKAARQKCPETAIELLRDIPTKFMPMLGEHCKDYGDGHINCKLPFYIGGGLILSGLFIGAIVIYLAIQIYKRKKAKKVSQENLKADNNNSDGESV